MLVKKANAFRLPPCLMRMRESLGTFPFRLTLETLRPAFAGCKGSVSGYNGSFCGDGQICSSSYHGS